MGSRDIFTCPFVLLTGDQAGTLAAPIDPKVGPLQNNGGFAPTRALLSGSPAIDAGNPAGCADADGHPLTTDQRGSVRPFGPRCDVGAFEFTPTRIYLPAIRR